MKCIGHKCYRFLMQCIFQVKGICSHELYAHVQITCVLLLLNLKNDGEHCALAVKHEWPKTICMQSHEILVYQFHLEYKVAF